MRYNDVDCIEEAPYDTYVLQRIIQWSWLSYHTTEAHLTQRYTPTVEYTLAFLDGWNARRDVHLEFQ